MKKFLLSLVSLFMLTLFAQAGEVKIAYTGETTTNMTGENDAALFGLSADDWSIVGDKGANSNFPGLNKAGNIRMYYSADGSNTITVSVTKDGAKINKISSISFVNANYSNVTVSVGGNLVEAVDGQYTINATSFVLGNGNTSNVQVQINNILLDVEGLGGEIVHIANTAETAYTVAKAYELIDAGEALDETVYVKGIVSQVDKFNDNYKSIQYWISDDGTTTNQFECYSGKGIGGADFASIDDVTVGATVVVKGTMKKYTPAEGDPIYEFNQNNELVSYEAPVADPYEEALKAIEDGAAYRIKGDVSGTPYYVTADGTLTSDANAAGIFVFTKVEGNGFKQYGYYIDGGKRFTNANLSDNKAVLDITNFATSTNNRADWEAQVMLLKDGKYAIRATNAGYGESSWADAGRVFFTWKVDEVAVPQYTYDEAYQWELEKAFTKDQVAAQNAAYNTVQSWIPTIQKVKGFVQDASQFSYNSKANESIGAPGLIDNDYSTYFHTQWGASGVTEPHYLQATLPDAADKFYFYFVKRDPVNNSNVNNRPTDIKISGSNDGETFTEITEITEGLPSTVPPVFYVSDLITATEAYKYIRFTVIDTNNHATDDNGNKFFTFSEFYILPATEEIGEALSMVKADTPVLQLDAAKVNATNEALRAYLDVVNVTYELYEGDKLIESKKVMQKRNSEISVPTGFTSDFSYTYNVTGTIETEDCTITITRAKKTIVQTLADLSNAKAYNIVCERGKFLTKDGYLASTALTTLTDATPANFAILNYKDSYYLYSVADKKFVTNDGALADVPTHGVLDAIKMEAKANPYFFWYFTVAEGTNYGLNTNGNDPYGYVINNWMNADGGNQYYMIEAADFDATDALAILQDTFDPVVSLNVPTFNVAEGTQAEPSMLPSGFTLKVNYSAKNLDRCGYNAEDLKVKVTVMVSGDLPENIMTMGSETAHRVMGESFYIPLGETDFPVALKPGYVYQNVAVMAAELVKGAETDDEEVIATYAGAPVQLHWVGIDAKVIYIETDMTSQFAALTNKDNWTTGAGGKAGYTATNFCPAVTPNGLNEVQVCEFYEGNCDRTGDLLYQTVTGLTEGTYTIELYGGAAYTFGRGFSSEAFSTGTWNAGDKITENTGVTLYATTSEGTFGGEIPIYYATNFPDGAAVVTLEGVKVGSNGEVKIGMSKTSKSTNWHVVQLKSVIATVNANTMLAASVEAANAIDKATIPAALATKLDDTVAANNNVYETADDYLAAISAIDAVVAEAKAYAPLTIALAKGEDYKAHSVNEEAKADYDAAIADVKTAYDEATVADLAAAIATVEAALPALAKTQTLAGADLTLFITNPDFETGNTEGWTYEESNDHGAKSTSNATYAMEGASGNYLFNIWSSGNAISQAIEGLPTGLYELKAVVATDEEHQVQLNANGKSVKIDATGKGNGIDSSISFFVTDGKATIGAEGVEKYWYKVDNFRLTLVKPLANDNAEYVNALASIENGANYCITTQVGETKYYLTTEGKLTAEPAEAGTFTMNMVEGNEFTYGFQLLDSYFTNPPSGGNPTLNNGKIATDPKSKRNDWEAQVFFLNEEGKYAVRATNAAGGESGWALNAATFWTVNEGPVAEYSFDKNYIWNLEKNTLIEIALNLVENDEVTATVTQTVPVGFVPTVPAEFNDKFHGLYSFTADVETITAETTAVNFTPVWKGLFDFSTDFDNAKWVNMNIRSGWYVSKCESEPYTMKNGVNVQTKNMPEYQWAFLPVEGEPFQMIIINKAAGAEQSLSVVQPEEGSPYVALSEGQAKWEAFANNDGFVIRPVGGGENDWVNQSGGASADNPLSFWQSANGKTDDGSTFRISDIPELHDIVLNAPTWSMEEGTQDEPNMLAKNKKLGITFTAENIKEYGVNGDYKVKMTIMMMGDLPGAPSMGSATAHQILDETFYVRLGSKVNFPEALKPGYIYQTVAVMSADLVKAATAETDEEEVVATLAAPAMLHWVGVEGENFDITIADTENGTVTANFDKAVEGMTIALTVTPDENYELEALTVVDAEGQVITVAEDNTFVMPAAAVSVSATFRALPVEYAGVIEQTVYNRATEEEMAKGDPEAQTISIAQGAEPNTVDITFVGGFTWPIGMPMAEFTIEGVVVTDNGDGSFSFAAPEGASIAVSMGQMTSTYQVELVGVQETAEAVPGFRLRVMQNFIDEVYFAADADAIATLKETFVPTDVKTVKAAIEGAEIYDLSGNKVQKVQKGKAYIIDGKTTIIK